MAYWWVNHKQTYKSEIEGGYIWSPKKNADGSKNQTYLNLTLTRPGDFVISYAGSEIRAIGVVASSCREQPKPSEYLKKSDGWATVGWAVPIDWEVLVCPVKPKENITKIAPLLPEKYSPLQSNGNGNQSCYLASISDDLGELIVDLSGSMNRESIAVVYEDKIAIEEEEIVKELASSDIEPTEKEQIIKARIGQGKFRKNVEKIESRCRVTLVSTKNLLVASHIKPWRFATNSERLDGENGLLLSPHIDMLFDKGWITFSVDGDLVCESKEVEEVLVFWGIHVPVNVGCFTDTQIKYLKFHQNHIYKGKWSF